MSDPVTVSSHYIIVTRWLKAPGANSLKKFHPGEMYFKCSQLGRAAQSTSAGESLNSWLGFYINFKKFLFMGHRGSKVGVCMYLVIMTSEASWQWSWEAGALPYTVTSSRPGPGVRWRVIDLWDSHDLRHKVRTECRCLIIFVEKTHIHFYFRNTKYIIQANILKSHKVFSKYELSQVWSADQVNVID